MNRPESQIIDLTFRHALIGTWFLDKDTAVEYTVSALGDSCMVAGVDLSDGEEFVITDVSWDGAELRFTTLMPSTQYELRHIFRVRSDYEVEHEWTRVETWHKKPAMTATPNHALQRTAPAVTAAAPPPSPAQPSRQPPPSLSLGSLGNSAHRLQNT